jgi:hypothetical protein
LNPVVVGGLLFGADQPIADWVNELCGGDKVFPPYVAIGVVGSQGLMAGAVFHSYQGSDVTVTAAALHPSLRLRSAIRAGISYAFDQLKVPRVTAEIDLSNARMIRLAQGLGFVREGVKRRAARDHKHHVGVFGLLKKDFKL